MFYNMLPRRRAFKPGPEEHNLLQDVLQKYAIYKAGSVGFTLKRQVGVGAGTALLMAAVHTMLYAQYPVSRMGCSPLAWGHGRWVRAGWDARAKRNVRADAAACSQAGSDSAHAASNTNQVYFQKCMRYGAHAQAPVVC